VAKMVYERREDRDPNDPEWGWGPGGEFSSPEEILAHINAQGEQFNRDQGLPPDANPYVFAGDVDGELVFAPTYRGPEIFFRLKKQ